MACLNSGRCPIRVVLSINEVLFVEKFNEVLQTVAGTMKASIIKLVFLLDKRTITSNGSSNNKCVDFFGTFIRIDGFGIGHKSGHVIF